MVRSDKTLENNIHVALLYCIISSVWNIAHYMSVVTKIKILKGYCIETK